MIERHLEIRTPDGEMEMFIAHPDGAVPVPVVVLYMDAPGIREELRDFVRRIAGRGYLCALPDLYYRRGRVRFDLENMNAEQGREMFGHMRSLTIPGVLSDTRALLEALRSMPEAAPGPKGCIGYCMSGRYVMAVAGTLPEHFRASISCYGVGIATSQSDSPHLLASNVQGEMLFAFAETDEYVPQESIESLRQELEAQGVRHQLEVYPGTGHGFCFPERKGAYAEDAAEDVWRRSFAMFERQLRIECSSETV